MKLFLCDGCNRHVKDSSETCPFCGTSKRGALVCDSSIRLPRMSRAAIAVGASVSAAVALALVDCSSAEYGGIYPGDAKVTLPDAKKDGPDDAAFDADATTTDAPSASDADADADADAGDLDAADSDG